MTSEFEILPQAPHDQPAIEALLDQAFGIGRRTKTSYRLREGEEPVPGLSFVARESGRGIVGAISFWSLRIGDRGTEVLLLGPLAVAPDRQGRGIGLALMKTGLSRAAAGGHRLVILVGDEPYYARAGFARVPEGRFILPGPVDPRRLLYVELAESALLEAEGLVLPPHRYRERATDPSGLRETTSRSTAPAGWQGR
jgi:predicted N-acetyltransferase YhbS